MNPALLMMLMSNNYRWSSLDEPDEYDIDDLDAPIFDGFTLGIIAGAAIVVGMIIYVSWK